MEPPETGEELSKCDEETGENDEEVEETDGSSAETKKEKPVKSGATTLNTHAPASMAYWVQSTDPRFYRPPQMFVGPTCVERCLDVLQRDVDYLLWVLRWGNTFFKKMSISFKMVDLYDIFMQI